MGDIAKSKTADWEAIERDYTEGKLSVREISRRHQVPESSVRSRAKIDKWSRLLDDKILRAAKISAAATDPRTGEQLAHGDPQVVASAAQRTAQIIVDHRKDLTELRELEAKLIRKITTDTGLPTTDRARVVKQLGDARCKRILVERQVWGLAEHVGETDVESIVRDELEALDADTIASMQALAHRAR